MLDSVHDCFRREAVLFTKHASVEMENEEFGRITVSDIYEAVLAGEIVVHYPEDSPLPSCLIFGRTRNGRPIHAVCGYDDEMERAVVITAYEPDPTLWIDFR